jgi:hypothetical protein
VSDAELEEALKRLHAVLESTETTT